jgi:molybdate transport system substrate-binding protein
MSTVITGISSMATRELLAALAAAYRERSGVEVAIESVGGVDAARRVAAGERFDLVVLAADAIERLAAAGAVAADSVSPLVRSEVAVAVRAGAPQPAVDSEAALRAAVLAAPRIGHSTGPSGSALLALFDRWGLRETLQPRLVQAPPGVPVGALVARGEVDLGFQQLSELQHLPGVTLLGTMPPEVAIVTVFSGAVASGSRQPQATRALLAYLRSPATAGLKRAHGMAPA